MPSRRYVAMYASTSAGSSQWLCPSAYGGTTNLPARSTVRVTRGGRASANVSPTTHIVLSTNRSPSNQCPLRYSVAGAAAAYARLHARRGVARRRREAVAGARRRAVEAADAHIGSFAHIAAPITESRQILPPSREGCDDRVGGSDAPISVDLRLAGG